MGTSDLLLPSIPFVIQDFSPRRPPNLAVELHMLNKRRRIQLLNNFERVSARCIVCHSPSIRAIKRTNHATPTQQSRPCTHGVRAQMPSVAGT